jgi:hypothetical protein
MFNNPLDVLLEDEDGYSAQPDIKSTKSTTALILARSHIVGDYSMVSGP